MAECDKGEKECGSEVQASSSPSCVEVASAEDYVHNPEEFIDIHGDHRKQRFCCADRGDPQGSESQNVSDMKMSSKVPNGESEFTHSPSGSHVLQDLKVPVQVSEECDVQDTHEAKLQAKNEDSDDEYQSADEGNGDGDKPDFSDEEEVEEDSEDEFIPAGDEDEYGGDGDHIRPFPRNDNVTVNEENNSEEKEKVSESDTLNEMEIRKKSEEALTEEERLERKEKGQKLKDDGNAKFRDGDYDEAIIAYSKALDICPLNFHKERSIMFANRAACKMKQELYVGAIQDSTSALDLHPHYLKALLRRAELYEKTEKLDEALQDYQKALELDPSQGMARAACVKLAEQIKDRNEKMKQEMIGKLKDLGNLVLRPFGLSVNNFNLQQDPNTGSYSVQFKQNPPNNGS